jgi:tRNA dimethylallyltransferase
VRLGGIVINADAMQVYRELALLTARPEAADRARTPHRLYGTVGAAEAYSVGRWLGDAGRAIAAALDEGRPPILVGGTGLYFKALTQGLAPIPDIPEEVRTYWRSEAARLGPERLHAALRARDPAVAARLGPTNPQRILRALEVIEGTGVSLAEWQNDNAPPLLRNADTLRLVIAPEREPLYAAIETRFEQMIERGAIEEVRCLVSLGLDPGLPAMRAHGVAELAAYLGGAACLEDAVAKAKTESRRYAKRQMTWARRYMADWDWVPEAAAAVEAATLALPTR